MQKNHFLLLKTFKNTESAQLRFCINNNHVEKKYNQCC